MHFRFNPIFIALACLLSSGTLSAQVTIWQENFSGANQGWTQNFTDCDGQPASFAGVQNNRFEVIDMEGAPCCASGGGNDNEWVTNDIDISGYCSVSLSAMYGFTGTLECEPGGPYFGCTGLVNIDNGHDQMIFEYSINGGAFVQFAYVCGGNAGTASVTGLTGNTIRIRIRPANKAIAELYWFDNVTVSGIEPPTVNPVNDITVCASGQQVNVMFSGTGNPAPIFSWTNSNTAIGLGASGTGNISFPTPVGLPSPQTGTITVTPTSAGCAGAPETFEITVTPPPTVDDPPNITVCPNDVLSVIFTGSSQTATYNWSASVPIPGGGINGTGNINVQVPPVIPFPVSANVTVTASENGCTGPQQVFTVSAFPEPGGNMTLTGSANICAGQNATFSVSFSSANAPYTFVYAIDGVNQTPITTNNNPYMLNVPLPGSATVSLVSITSNGCTGDGTGSAAINVTPLPTASITPGSSNICTGGSADIEIDFTGTGPFTFIHRINGINQAPITTAGPTYTLTVSPNNPGTYNYTLSSVTSNGCTGSVSGSYAVTVVQSPTATLTGGATVCAGQGTTLTVSFSGTGPFTFDYTADGVPQGPITTSNNPLVFVVAPSVTTVYELTEVSAGGCAGTAQGIAIVNVNPSPTATLVSGSASVCSGQSASLTINFTGPSPYTFVYAVNTVNQPPITTSQSSYTLSVSPANGVNTYTLFSVSGGGCNGTVSGTFTVNVGSPPTAVISGDTTICPGDTALLFVNFTGSGPFTYAYTANGIDTVSVTTGDDPDTLFVSPPNTTAYTLISVNSNGCSGTFSGMATVSLMPTVSAEISGGGQICQGDTGISITVTFFGTGPYTFVYSANNVNQPPIMTNSNPYTFTVNPAVGTKYVLVSVSNGTCFGAVSGEANVKVFTPPTADLTGDQTFCDSANTTVMIDFTGTGPFTIIYTIDGVAQPPDSTFDDPYIIPVSTTQTTIYEIISVESPGCVGDPEGTATITINYAPTYANLDLTCNLVNGTYIVEFDVLGTALPLTLISGSGTFTGNHFTSDPIAIPQPFNFIFHDANDCGDVTVSGPSNCNCITDAGTMDLAAISACVGDTVTAQFNNNFTDDGNDILRFILHTTPATPVGTIIAWNSTPVFSFQPGMTAGVTYYISAVAGNNDGSGNVNLSDPCLSISQGTPVTFYPLPTAGLAPNDTICAGTQAIVPVTMTGVAPFSLTWALNGVQQPTAVNIPSPTYNLVIQPVADVTVTLISVEDSRCAATASDTAIIVVNGPPQVTNLATACDFNTMTYTLTFTASGLPPFNITGIGGSFTGNQFTSMPIPASSGYSFTIADANGCGQTTISGTANCSCVTNAGSMDQSPVTVCVTDILTVPSVTGQILDNDDILLYILHSNPGEPAGTIWAWSATPQFSFQIGMQANVTYYVSAIAGNPDGTGQIDLNDPCLSIAMGTPVQFHALPLAELVALDTSVCQFRPVTFTVNLTGTAPFSFIPSVSGTPQAPVTGINGNTYSWTFSPSQNTVVQLDSVSDFYCSTGMVLGTATVNVFGVPSFTNVQTVCDTVTQTYTVTCQIQNGVAPFSISGLTGTIIGNQFLSDPIPSGSSYEAILSDVNNCGQDTLSGTITCNCTTNAGTLNQTSLTPCAGQAVSIQPATGTFLDPNDTLIYVLVTAPAPPAWTILATNSTPDFNFIPGTMSPGTTYYIVALAGNILGNSVDLNDPCLSVAAGPSVTWQAPVTASILGNETICTGGQSDLTVQFTGNGPFTFTYDANGSTQQVNTPQNPYSLLVSPSVSTTYTLVSVSGANGCTGTVSGMASVTVTTLQVLNVQTICDLAAQTYVLQFDVDNGPAPDPAYTVSGVSGAFTGSTFTSNPIPATQPYNATVTDPSSACTQTVAGEADCLCDTDAGTVSVMNGGHVCLPAQAVAQPGSDEFLEADDVLQFILYQDPAQLPLGIIATSATPQFDFMAGMTTGTTYYISAIAGNNDGSGNIDLSDPCLSISPGVAIVFHDPPTAVIAGDSTFCPGNNAAFQIQFTGTAPFKFVYALNGAPQPQISAPGNTFSITTNNVQQSQVFTLVSVEDANCTGTVSGQATVTIIPAPTGLLIGDATICAGDSTTLGLVLSGGASYDVTISGGGSPIQLSGVQNGDLINVAPAATTTYTITALTASGNNCPATPGIGATITVSDLGASAILSDYNGFGVSCPNAEDGSISLTLTGGIQPVSASWNNGLTGLQLNNLDPGDYTVTLTDQAGCVLLDSFTLTAPPELLVETEIESPKCFDGRDGSITILSIQGGAGPYTLAVNGAPGQVLDTLPAMVGQLVAGDYTLEIADINGCITETDLTLPAPLPFNADLGPDITINFGDSTILKVVHNSTALDTFFWSPTDFLLTPDSLITSAKPLKNQVYAVNLLDTAGCSARDEILVTVVKGKRVFMPNIIRPESIEANDAFTVYAGPEVRLVRKMHIYDRWGELLFENQNFIPNDPQFGWRGKARGKAVNPGVYVYAIEVEYIDGSTEVLSGDVTVVR